MASVVREPISRFVFPRDYVRQRVSGPWVNELEETLRACQPRRPTKPEHFTAWPFPPLDVRPIEGTPAKNGKPAPTALEIVAGRHRFLAAKHCGMEKIPCLIKPRSEAEAFFDQLASDLRHGLKLDHEMRDAAIRTLVKKFRFSLRVVEKRTGLSASSVSRIVRGIQYVHGVTRRPRAEVGHGARRPSGPPAPSRIRTSMVRESHQLTEPEPAPIVATWSPIMFVRQLEGISIEWTRHRTEIDKALEAAGRSLRVSTAFVKWLTEHVT